MYSYVTVVTCNLTSEYEINVILYSATMRCYATHGTTRPKAQDGPLGQTVRQTDRQTDRQTLKIVGQLSDS